MWHSIANIILRNKFIILGVIALVTVYFGYEATTNLKLDNKHGILLPQNAPAKKHYDRFKDMFGEDGGTLIIAIETDSLYTEENFRKWKELGDSILQIEGVNSVVSEATLFTVTNNQEERKFEAHRVFSDVSYKEKSIDSIKREIRNNPLYRGLLYNKRGNVSLMIVSVNEDFISDQIKANFVVELENLATEYEPYFGKPRFTGMPHIRVQVGKQVLKEMYVFIALLILITSLIMFMFFRSIRVVLICNLVVAIAVIWSMGTIAALSYHLTVITALIPPLMIVIGIPNCIFLFTKYHQEIKEHGNKALALSRTIRKIGTATFLTNLTTAIGFITFVTTNSPKLVQFGIVAAINIMLVFVLSLTVIPIVVSLSRSPKPKHLQHLERKLAVGLIDNLINITVNHRRWVYIILFAVIAFSIAGMVQIKATGQITSDLPGDNQILKDLKFVEKEFGGTIPFEIMVDYKEPSRIAKKSTLLSLEQLQDHYDKDTLFSKHVSYINMLKAANMAYHNNDSTQYRLITSKRALKNLKEYIDSSLVTNAKGVGVALNELIDTANRVLRIRAQMLDIGSFKVIDKADSMRVEIDSILNPDKKEIERLYSKFNKSGKFEYVDTILSSYSGITNELAEHYIANDDERYNYDMDPMGFLAKHYTDKDFKKDLRASIDYEYFDVTLTGTSIVASQGTRYMVVNLLTSLIFAILIISILMAILFRSWRMVLISMIPNFIPLLFTAGVMGWFGVPLKPSTLLVFSIAFGISIDDTIHYLAKYRLELKAKQWDLKQCVIMAIREAGLGMFYTSIILFAGFVTFAFSQFGGTQALGILISLTLLIAMITNLVVLPSLLLSLEHRITTKSFEEPFFDAYAEESQIDWDNLDLVREIDDSEESIDDNEDAK